MDGSGHHANGEVGVRPELGASAFKPSTRYARIPPCPPSEELSVSHIFLLDTGGVLL
jgi:hypothetical protein